MYAHTKLYSVISYITWIGWVIAFILHDRRDKIARVHINQALIINIIGVVGTFCSRFDGLLGTAGYIINIAVLVFTILGIVRAVQLSSEPLPIIGDFKIIQ